jgi:hypothetical protein
VIARSGTLANLPKSKSFSMLDVTLKSLHLLALIAWIDGRVFANFFLCRA